MISVGDVVVYGTSGVCRFNGTVTKKTAFGTSEYFEFVSCRDNSNRTYMPKKEELLKKVRHVMTHDEALDVVKSTMKKDVILIANDEERNNKFSAMLKENDCASTVLIVRSLHALQKEREARGNHLHSADERMLRLAQRLADDELSYALGIDRDSVAKFVHEFE